MLATGADCHTRIDAIHSLSLRSPEDGNDVVDVCVGADGGALPVDDDFVVVGDNRDNAKDQDFHEKERRLDVDEIPRKCCMMAF